MRTSNVYDVTVTNSASTLSGLRAARKMALAEARESMARGHVGGECRVKHDMVSIG